MVSSFRLKGFPFSLGLRRLGKICDDSRMCTSIVFVVLLFPVILGTLVILFCSADARCVMVGSGADGVCLRATPEDWIPT